MKKDGIEVVTEAFEQEKKGIELLGGDSDRRKQKEMPDKEKLSRFRCAQSLFNISKELEDIENMASNVCLIMAKGLIVDVSFPENTGSMHSQQTVHNSKVTEEVEAMAEKIKNQLSADKPHNFHKGW